jgi:predicted membrane protein
MKTRTVIQIVFLFIIGLILLLLLKWTTIGIIVLSISAVILSGCLCIRRFSSRFEKFTQFLIEAFSLMLSWLLLTPIYYLVFTPIRLILLIRKQDPMNRQFPTKEESCWISVEQKEIPDQYRKQF